MGARTRELKKTKKLVRQQLALDSAKIAAGYMMVARKFRRRFFVALGIAIVEAVIIGVGAWIWMR